MNWLLALLTPRAPATPAVCLEPVDVLAVLKGEAPGRLVAADRLEELLAAVNDVLADDGRSPMRQWAALEQLERAYRNCGGTL